MKKYVLYFMVAAIILTFFGCGYSEEEVSALCSEQYELGYNSGESVGFDTGYEEGYSVGYSEGYDLGNNAGYESGYTDGKNDGYLAGEADGYSSGLQEGKKNAADNSSDHSDVPYIGNKNSNVFHLASCSSLPKTENRVYFTTREEATEKGYRPCSRCNP